MKKSQLHLADVQQMHREGRLEDAKLGYAKLLKENPNDPTLLHMLGILTAEEGRLDEARDYLEAAIKADPNNPTYVLHLANVLKGMGLFAEATKILLLVIKNHPNSPAAYNNLGITYYGQEKWQDAIAAYEKAIALQPEFADAYYNLGLALTKASQWEAAVNAYKALLELVPKHPGGLFQLGCINMQRMQYQTAIDKFNLVAQDHPYHFETQSNLATCYLKLGKLNEAKQHYLAAFEIMPNDEQILFNLGVISMHQGRVKEAVEFYLRVVKINPDFFDAHNNLGVAFLALKNMDNAILHFREALRIQPQYEALRHTISILAREKNISTSPPEYVRSLFDSYADHYDKHMVDALHYQIPNLIYKCMQQADVLKNEKWDILDLGCGTGLCGEKFANVARTLVGVDISERMLEVASQKNIYNELVCSDILPFLVDKIEIYDLVMAGDVWVYYGDLKDMFLAVAQSMRKYGYFIFNAEISEDKEDYVMTASGRFAHTKDYLERLISQSHLTVLRYETVIMRTQADIPVKGHLYLLTK